MEKLRVKEKVTVAVICFNFFNTEIASEALVSFKEPLILINSKTK